MSPRLDLPLAIVAWFVGFAWVARTGSWTLLAVFAVTLATRLLVGDRATRRLFARNSSAVVLGVSAALVSILMTRLLYAPIVALIPDFAYATHKLYGIMNAEGYRQWRLLLVILLVVVSEEIVWRGRLLSRDETVNVLGAAVPVSTRPLSWQIAQALLCAAIYGTAHVPSGSVLLVFLAGSLGAMWALLRIVTGSLWAPVIAHALWDIAVLIVWPVV